MMQTSTAKRQAEEQVGERRATFEEPGRPASERRPAFIVQLGGTDISLEPEVAADIFVVPNSCLLPWASQLRAPVDNPRTLGFCPIPRGYESTLPP